jgi:imidazolonepropionase-like amidohydrolase
MQILSNVATLYDGTSVESTSIKRGVDVIIDDGRIRELRPHDPAQSIGDAHTRIDCSRYTVTPGLVDCHGHITSLGLGDADEERMRGQAALFWVEKILYASLVDGGVTTMRDIGGATHFMKRMLDEGVLIGPRLKIAICMLSTTGGHADFRGPDRCHAELSPLWPEAPGRPSSIVDGPWECRKRVREIAACGADLIKLCTSPGVASPSDKLENRDFSGEEIAAICDEAAGRGLRVAAHAHSTTGISMAIEHGVHDIQHASFMDEALVERAHAAGCVVTPTSWVVNEIVGEQGLPPSVREKAKQIAEVHARATQLAAKGGLPVLMGTDPVLQGMHGRNYLELVHLIKDGLTPLQAWHGATGLAAREIGQDDSGTLEAGKRADLLVCDADVLNDPGLLDGGLVEVLKDGEGYRGGLDGVPQRNFRSATEERLGELESAATRGES